MRLIHEENKTPKSSIFIINMPISEKEVIEKTIDEYDDKGLFIDKPIFKSKLDDSFIIDNYFGLYYDTNNGNKVIETYKFEDAEISYVKLSNFWRLYNMNKLDNEKD